MSKVAGGGRIEVDQLFPGMHFLEKHRKILDHLKEKGECPEGIRLPESQAPPMGLFT